MQNLPVDIQELIFASCNPSSIASFSATCRLSQSVALHSGWPAYNRAHLNAHLHCVTSPLPSREGVKAAWERARWSTLVERGWDDRLLTLQKLHLGMRKTLPVLLLHEEGSRLIIGAGTRLFVILFDDRGRPLLCRPITLGRTCREDVTGVAACEPGSTDDLIVSHLCGWVRRIRLSFYPSTDPHYAWELAFVEVARFDHPAASRLQNISSSGNLFATIATARSSPAHPSRGGVASLYQSRSPWIDPTKVQLQTRPWSVHLSRSSSVGPWLAVGHEGPSPISLFPISESEVLPSPTSLSGEKGRTSAYALSVGATTPNLLAAGLYDGSVRVYDVRSDCRTKDASGKEAMRSVVHLREKFLDSPTYSVAMGGPGGALVAAGSARHSVVRPLRSLTTGYFPLMLALDPGVRHEVPRKRIEIFFVIRGPLAFVRLRARL